MTPERLAELEHLANAATPGPWKSATWYGSDDGGFAAIGPHHVAEEYFVRHQTSSDPDDMGEEERCLEDGEPDGPVHERAKRDAAFVAAARTAVPELIAEIRRLRAVLMHVAGAPDMLAARFDIDAALRGEVVP